MRSSASVGVDSSNMRRHNLELAFREVGRQPRTRAQLASDLRLAKGTVSSLVDELQQRGLLEVSNAVEMGAIGRPGRLVNVVKRRVYGIGITVSEVYLVGALVNLGGEIIGRFSVPLETPRMTEADLLAAVVSLVRRIDKESPNIGGDGLLGGITVGVPQLVDSSLGIVRRSSSLGIANFAFRDALKAELCDVTKNVFLDNDANLAALAEARSLPLNASLNPVLLTGSLSIGGGLLVDGKLLRGAKGYAGEIGHMVIDPHGKLCSCGSFGCFESEVGLLAFLEAVARPGDQILNSAIPVDERIEIVLERAERQDAHTITSIQSVGTSLGLGLCTLINILNPSAIVLGGYFTQLFPYLVEPANAVLRRRILPELLADCPVLSSTLGLYGGAIGAAFDVLDRVMLDPGSVPFLSDRSNKVNLM